MHMGINLINFWPFLKMWKVPIDNNENTFVQKPITKNNT